MYVLTTVIKQIKRSIEFQPYPRLPKSMDKQQRAWLETVCRGGGDGSTKVLENKTRKAVLQCDETALFSLETTYESQDSTGGKQTWCY